MGLILCGCIGDASAWFGDVKGNIQGLGFPKIGGIPFAELQSP